MILDFVPDDQRDTLFLHQQLGDTGENVMKNINIGVQNNGGQFYSQMNHASVYIPTINVYTYGENEEPEITAILLSLWWWRTNGLARH